LVWFGLVWFGLVCTDSEKARGVQNVEFENVGGWSVLSPDRQSRRGRWSASDVSGGDGGGNVDVSGVEEFVEFVEEHTDDLAQAGLGGLVERRDFAGMEFKADAKGLVEAIAVELVEFGGEESDHGLQDL